MKKTYQSFEMKIECIRKKKSIEFCQAFINRGESVDQDALQEYLRRELEEYRSISVQVPAGGQKSG